MLNIETPSINSINDRNITLVSPKRIERAWAEYNKRQKVIVISFVIVT